MHPLTQRYAFYYFIFIRVLKLRKEKKLVSYPISIVSSNYKGSDPVKRAKQNDRNRLSFQLENFINNKLLEQKSPIQVYSYHEISSETGIPLEVVRDLCFSIYCGGSGFTAIKHGLTYDEAIEQSTRGVTSR
ncbi:TPA: hypothetical protein ACGUW8_004301 [Vibrio vulnificus]